jgi:hypothetical protein
VYCYELYHQIRKLNDEITPEQADAPTSSKHSLERG